MRATLATDARLPFGVVGTIEGLYTRATRAMFFSPINLSEPVASDRHDRLHVRDDQRGGSGHSDTRFLPVRRHHRDHESVEGLCL